MFDLCKILGVEEDEVFKLNGAPYKVVSNQMYQPDGVGSSGIWVKVSYSLNLLAEAEFERMPFVPKFGEQYFYVQPDGTVNSTINEPYELDLYRIKTRNCFKTEVSAIQQGIPLMEQWKKELGWE